MGTKTTFNKHIGMLHDLAYDNNSAYRNTFMDEVFHSMRDYLDDSILGYGLDKFGSIGYSEREYKAGRKCLRDALAANGDLNAVADSLGFALAHFYTAFEANNVSPQTNNGKKRTKSISKKY